MQLKANVFSESGDHALLRERRKVVYGHLMLHRSVVDNCNTDVSLNWQKSECDTAIGLSSLKRKMASLYRPLFLSAVYTVESCVR